MKFSPSLATASCAHVLASPKQLVQLMDAFAGRHRHETTCRHRVAKLAAEDYVSLIAVCSRHCNPKNSCCRATDQAGLPRDKLPKYRSDNTKARTIFASGCDRSTTLYETRRSQYMQCHEEKYRQKVPKPSHNWIL